MADLELWVELAHGLALSPWLTELLQAPSVPASLRGRMDEAITAALQRALARTDTRSVRLTILTGPPRATRTVAASGWGFFLVEKPADDSEQHRIEVFLYRETG